MCFCYPYTLFLVSADTLPELLRALDTVFLDIPRASAISCNVTLFPMIFLQFIVTVIVRSDTLFYQDMLIDL